VSERAKSVRVLPRAPDDLVHGHCDPERLVALVKSGNPVALDALTRCYGERLLAAGKRHCRTASEAEDAVQNTLLFAVTGLETSFRGEGTLEGFLSRIVANACRRLSRGRKNLTALHDTDAELVEPSPSPEARAAEGELGARLTDLLLGLDPRDRAALLLAELEGYTASEIAAELGLSAGAVRTRLTRSRQRLRAGLAPFTEADGEKSTRQR
jgi:RNA polymerase sigma-70 factor, ECF subfamily